MNPLLTWRYISAAVLFVALLVWAPFALAHKTSYGYLNAVFTGDKVTGKLELAVRDFDFAFSTTPLAPAPMGAARSTGISCIATNMRLPVSSSTKSRSGLPPRHAPSTPAPLVSIRSVANITLLCRSRAFARRRAGRCRSATI